ncbi:MAG: hypothetical protein IJ759_02920 [Bacteroidales bacterium]|nr:hypothetical protein [Bacteroidales bacterium]
MKKLILALALFIAVPLTFTSCGDDDTSDIWSELAGMTVGSMKVSLGGQSQSYTGVGYYQDNGTTYIATANTSGVVGIKLDGVSVSKTSYTLGIMSDNVITSLLSGGFEIGKFNNIMAFKPYNGEIYVVVSGTLTLSASAGNLTGTFTGKAVPQSYVENLAKGNESATSILSIITGSNAETIAVSGQFSAKETNSLGSTFSGLFSK